MKFLEKVLSLGLYLLAFLLPLQTRLFIRPGELNGGYFEYGTISIYGTDILLIFLVGIFYLSLRAQRSSLGFGSPNQRSPRSLRSLAMTGLLIGLNLVSLISIFFAGDKLVAMQAYIRLTLGMGLFFVISRATYNYLKLIYAFLAGAVVQASLGIWQFLAQATFASKWLGLAAHPAEVGGSSVIETLDGGRWLRAYGGLDHPNVFGGFLSVSLLLIVYLMLRNETGKKISNFQIQISNKIQNPKSKIQNYVFYSLFLILLTALFFTFSRGAWAGFIAGSIIILVFKLWQRDKSSLRQLFTLAAASAVLVSVLFINYQDLATTRLSNNARLEIKSNLERTASYKDGIAIIKDRWLVGVGIGGYTLALVKLYPAEPSWFYQPTHNTFLLVFAETGIVGLILFICIIGFLLISNDELLISNRILNDQLPDEVSNKPYFWKLIRNLKLEIRNWFRTKRNFYKLPIIIALVVMMLADHYYWSLHFGVLFFWFLLGLAARIEKAEHTSPPF